MFFVFSNFFFFFNQMIEYFIDIARKFDKMKNNDKSHDKRYFTM